MEKRWVDLKENIFYRLFVGACYVDLKENVYKIIDGENGPDDLRFSTENYDEMINEYVEKIVHQADRELVKVRCTKEYLLGRLVNESFFFYDFRRLVDGQYRWYRMHVVVDGYDENGDPRFVLLANMYIDDVKQHECAYQEKLEAASRAKSDFLSNISHDLRTPMNAIMGFITLIEKDADNPYKVREDVKKMKASGRHLLSIINDVLDMNKIESGVMAINSVEFELSTFLEDINTVTLQLTRDKTQNFRMELENVTVNKIVGDKSRLNQVLVNILSNSIKYTGESGDIRLIVRQVGMDEKCHLQFEVVDNGIGMEQEFLTKIFEPFAREEERIPDDATGTGLGMAITKNLVDLMGGEVHIESEPGCGTRFILDMFFVVPKDSMNVIADLDENFELEVKSLEGKNFLVAEDNEINGEIISRLLELEGATSTVCANGKLAVEAFLNNPEGTFDMILMDVRMPVLDGYGATRLIRDNGRADSRKIPIISMTANAFSEDVELAKAAGMNAHVPKPIDFEVLKSTVKKYMK